MTPIRPVKPRLMFLRRGVSWGAFVPPLIGIAIMVALIYSLYIQFNSPPSSVTRLVFPTEAPVREVRSADGKTVCYIGAYGMSCLPT